MYSKKSPLGTRERVFSTPITHAAPVRLDNFLRSLDDVHLLTCTPDGRRVVFRGRLSRLSQRYRLFSVPIDTPVGAVRLDQVVINDGHVRSFNISPDSRAVVYTANERVRAEFHHYKVPIDGRRERVRISGEEILSFEPAIFTSDGTRILYANEEVGPGDVDVMAHVLGGRAPGLSPPR